MVCREAIGDVLIISTLGCSILFVCMLSGEHLITGSFPVILADTYLAHLRIESATWLAVREAPLGPANTVQCVRTVMPSEIDLYTVLYIFQSPIVA